MPPLALPDLGFFAEAAHIRHLLLISCGFSSEERCLNPDNATFRLVGIGLHALVRGFCIQDFQLIIFEDLV
jgi:hypothetical protein